MVTSHEGPKLSQVSQLLRLPAELRNHIYHYALQRNYALNIKPGVSGGCWKPPPLLMICSQIRSEAMPVYYGNNAFSFHDYYIWVQWLALLGSQNVHIIKRFRSNRCFNFGRDTAMSDLDFLLGYAAEAGFVIGENSLFVHMKEQDTSAWNWVSKSMLLEKPSEG